jgi:hypothetical protein
VDGYTGTLCVSKESGNKWLRVGQGGGCGECGSVHRYTMSKQSGEALVHRYTMSEQSDEALPWPR